MSPTDRIRQARLSVDLARTAHERRRTDATAEHLELALAELERAEIEEIEGERRVAA